MNQLSTTCEYSIIPSDTKIKVSMRRMTDGSILTHKLIATDCCSVYADGTVRTSKMYSVFARLSSDGDSYEELVTDVTHNSEKARSLFDMIINGMVTPCSLKDIVEDFL